MIQAWKNEKHVLCSQLSSDCSGDCRRTGEEIRALNDDKPRQRKSMSISDHNGVVRRAAAFKRLLGRTLSSCARPIGMTSYFLGPVVVLSATALYIAYIRLARDVMSPVIVFPGLVVIGARSRLVFGDLPLIAVHVRFRSLRDRHTPPPWTFSQDYNA